MKYHHRRAEGKFPYFKVAAWDPRSMTFRDGKKAFASEAEALASIPRPGRFRLSVVTAENERRDLEPIDIT